MSSTLLMLTDPQLYGPTAASGLRPRCCCNTVALQVHAYHGLLASHWRHRAGFLTYAVALQGRVTDHRVNITEHGIDQVLRGERLFTFINALQQQHLSELMDAVSRG